MALADGTRGVSAFDEADGSRRALSWVALAELLALSLWFSASAVAPALSLEWSMSAGEVAGLTSWVQIGFVVGALAIAFSSA